MEIKKIENRTFGDYYRVTEILRVDGKPYKASQRTTDPQKLGAQWDLTRSQMISILRHTEPQDWLFRSKGHFDGQIDGWQYDNEGFRPATQELIAEIIKDLEQFDRTRIQYNAGDRDQFTNKLEHGVFEVWNLAVFSDELKPARGDLVRFGGSNPSEIAREASPNERKAESPAVRIVPTKEVIECPTLRLDARHYVPRHRTEDDTPNYIY